MIAIREGLGIRAFWTYLSLSHTEKTPAERDESASLVCNEAGEAPRGERTAEEDEDVGECEGCGPISNDAGRAEARYKAARIKVADAALADAIRRQRKQDT